jgi:DnaJ-class molecular chaperone
MRLEYLGLLRDFGLPPEASIKEIKAMYRSKVKVHHPDAAGGGDQASDDFLRMNEKYERLLQLHESLAGNGDPEA